MKLLLQFGHCCLLSLHLVILVLPPSVTSQWDANGLPNKPFGEHKDVTCFVIPKENIKCPVKDSRVPVNSCVLALGSHEGWLHTKLCLCFLHSNPATRACMFPWGTHQGLLLPGSPQIFASTAYCFGSQDTKTSLSLNSNTPKWLLLFFFYKLCLSKMAGHLRENDTNLC